MRNINNLPKFTFITAFITLYLALFASSTVHAQNLIPESTFNEDSTGGWWTTANLDATITDGQFCATTTDDGGTNPWDTIFGHGDLNLEAGRLYDLYFDLSAPAGVNVSVFVQMGDDPYMEYYGLDVIGNGVTTHYESPYRHPTTDPAGQLIFQFGGQGAGTVCIDNVIIGPPSATPIATNAIHVNQLGYFVDGAKHATVVNASTEPQVWTLLNEDGITVRQGVTTVYGNDEGSGLHLHQIDFSSYKIAGSGYTIQLTNAVSHPFEISENLYEELIYDASRYYYFARSTDPLVMPYVDSILREREGGPADDNVRCWPGSGCDYALDVSKGWYDAGDYGKYIVNSGFSVWQLMNLYERGLHIAPETLAPFADGMMNIPESGNSVSDLLDEVRYNLEFMLGMQVPDGEPLAGMVHHKIHNTEWHEVGMSPFGLEGDEGGERYLTPSTTTATLYFAGAMAQCARIWTPVDAAFSAQCRSVAESAWAAAIANPAVTHPDEPYNNGGGPYGNLDSGDVIADEFYWAAAELFITTGKQAYQDFLLASPNHLAPGEVPISSYEIDMIGRISLSTVPNNLPKDELDAVKATVINLADFYVEMVNSTGFGVPISADNYYWGSNSTLLNKVMVLGVAYDISGDAIYLTAAQEGMNYILGRNPLGQSYVTGHGERATLDPVSTWYANIVNPDRPIAPAGFLVGGANRTHPDIFATEALTGCVGSTCYIDHIRAYSTNETAINVNASLVWATGFLISESSGQSEPQAKRTFLYLPMFSE